MTARLKTYKPLYKFCTCLSRDFGKDDCEPFFETTGEIAKRLLSLGTDCYTTICLSDGVNVEVMDLHMEQGCLVVDRKDDERHSWECGAKVEFLQTVAVLDQYEPPEHPEAMVDYYSGTFCAGNYDLEVKNGKIVDCKKVRHIREGQYLNAAVCIDKNGCVTDIAEGNPLRTGKTCYNCGE